MNAMILPAFRRALLITGSSLLLGGNSPAVTLPVITAPPSGARIVVPHVDVRVSVSGIQDVRSVQILDKGALLGNASPTSIFGEWSFPDGSHVSIMSGEDDAVKIDYTPPNAAPMFLIDGAMTGPNTMTGTYIHWPGGGITLDGDVSATFSFTQAGLLKIVLQGDAPLGTRTVTGGLSLNEDYQFAWNQPAEGNHSLVARVTYLPSGSETPATLDSAAIAITIDLPPAPEIAVQQPKGSDLTDGSAKRAFGTARVGKEGQMRTFVIKNTGSAKLKGLDITRRGANAADFIVNGPTDVALASGKSTTFTVTFKPKAKGLRTAALQIKSNDTDENPFDIQLSGQAVKP